MPAGKIFNATAALRSRRVRRTRRKASSFKKAVSTIAKSVVLRQVETKTFNYSVTQAIGTNGLLLTFCKQITQGTGQGQRIGDRIRMLGLKMRTLIQVEPTVITSNGDGVQFRMLVFTGKRPFASLTDTGLTYNNSVDPELINVISDRNYVFKQDGRLKALNGYYKANRIVSYNPTGSDPSKNELYVAIIPMQHFGTGMSTTAGLYINSVYQLYWKDP